MSERLSQVAARIRGIRELGAVVNAMRGIAGARARQARDALRAVELYAASLSGAIGTTLALSPRDGEVVPPARGRALILFMAEQGFAGTFNERLLEAVPPASGKVELFLVGTRGAALAQERGIRPVWSGAMPAHPDSIPRLADRIATELYARIAAGAIGRLDALFARTATEIETRSLFPLDPKAFATAPSGNAPLLDLPPATLLADLTADYIHAQLCDAALHAFAAENDARMAAMAAAHREIGRQLAQLEMTQRIVRQDEITAEIIELAAGEAAQG
ncbi:MAG TPA: FoF1 ATP synthase subunit gamma [Rhizomicrobium sp.]